MLNESQERAAPQTDLAGILAIVHRRVRVALAETPLDPGGPGADVSGQLNPKGDVQRPFDLAADERIRQELDPLGSLLYLIPESIR